ncbi:methyltransferase domain-containing protein [Bacterioplanoides sp.]|uniref:methyltransferase domain-containing protein n=1 Tax=Bacterioplanoides sp. TaxID=2066072 RepID=UPI003AFF8176
MAVINLDAQTNQNKWANKSQDVHQTRDKKQVARQFSRAAASYDQAATIQQQAIEQLLTFLPNKPNNDLGHWLDIGCGTGAAFKPLLNAGIRHVTGVDLAEGMLQFAQQQFSQSPQIQQLEFIQADADVLPFHDGSKQGIFSSLMLQWSENPLHTLHEWQRVLAPGSTLAIATLLPGTQQELSDAWHQIDERPHVNQFVEKQRLLGICEQLNLEVISQHQTCLTEHYDSLTELLRSLKAIGATNVNSGRKSGLGGRAALRLLDQFYPRDEHGKLPVSYQVLWLVLRKS